MLTGKHRKHSIRRTKVYKKRRQSKQAAESLKGERTLEFKKENLIWTREPKNYEIKDGEIRITTEPGTDLWQRTYYGFQNDNAPVLQMKTSEKYF